MTFNEVPEALVGLNVQYLCLSEQILGTLCCIVLPDSLLMFTLNRCGLLNDVLFIKNILLTSRYKVLYNEQIN